MSYLILIIGMVLGAALAGVILSRTVRRQPASTAWPDLEGVAMGAMVIRGRQVLRANARCGEILGVDAELLVGAGTRPYYLDEAAYETFERDVLEVCREGQRFRGDIRLRRVDGTPFWAYLVGGLLVPGQPEAGMLWFLEDVTERVEAQLDLSEVLSLNQKLIAASPTGILLYQAADGSCVMANQAAARIVDARTEDLLKQNFRRIASWKECGLREGADRALASGMEQRLEAHFTSSFGKELWVVAHFVPFMSRGERILLLLLDDISERVRAASALRATEEKYRVVVETLNEGLALVDAEGRFTFCNGRLCEMSGYALDEMIGQHYSTFVSEADLPSLVAMQLLSSSMQAETFELGLVRRDRSVMESRVSLASVMGPQGTPVALAILVTDISVRKRVERERERLLGELEQKNKELETLLYVASHDLRSPLVNIQGFSQRLAKSLDEIRRHQEGADSLEAFRAAIAPHVQERMPSSLEFIKASGVKMDAIINGLLSLSRAGRMVLRAETLDMNALLRTCSASLAFQLQSAEGVLEVDDLPPCKADPNQTAQIVSNLLDNAVKYRHPDRPLRIRVQGRVAGDVCVYSVQDNGKGISPEYRERIWEIFQRLDPLGPIQGEGLGLTLVRRMAERNGGRVWVDSAPENGCVFHLELPVGSS